jgi:hypothetical protein
MKRYLLGTLLLSSALFAQPEEEVKKLREEVEVLKEEIRKLRLEIAAPEITEYRSYTGLGPAASKALFNPKGVSIGGYGEIWFTNIPQDRPNFEADLFRFIIYLGYAFTEKLKFNSEIEIEHAKVEGGEEGGEVAIEFAFLDYRFNKVFGIRGGTVLVPLGITNEYHEPPTYFSVRQPYLEKKLFPFTWRENGIGVYGETDLLEFRAYLINGMKAERGSYDPTEPLDSITQDASEAVSDGIAFTGRVDLKLPKNLKVGLATFISPVMNGNGDRLGTVNLFSPHLWWQYAGFDVRFVGAYANVSGADKISQELNQTFPERMQGFYLQIAYNVFRFLDTDHELYVFGKIENVDRYSKVPQGYTEPTGSASELNVVNFGLSYRPHPLVALKADYARENYKLGRDRDVYSAAITWMF